MSAKRRHRLPVEDRQYAASADAKKAGWFSRRHRTGEAHALARKQRGPGHGGKRGERVARVA